MGKTPESERMAPVIQLGRRGVALCQGPNLPFKPSHSPLAPGLDQPLKWWLHRLQVVGEQRRRERRVGEKTSWEKTMMVVVRVQERNDGWTTLASVL
jgi:hypothetical protein